MTGAEVDLVGPGATVMTLASTPGEMGTIGGFVQTSDVM